MGIGAHYKLKHPKFSLFIYHSKEEKNRAIVLSVNKFSLSRNAALP